MIEKVIETSTPFIWLDIVDPTAEELHEVALQYGLHESSVQDCLDTKHLPKFEQLNTVSFIILRSFDEYSYHDADTVHELTRKLALFHSKDFLITIHRKEQPYISQIKAKWSSENKKKQGIVTAIIYDLIEAVLNSYEFPITEALDRLETLEIDVFEAQGSKPFDIKDGYYLKRKASVFKRMIRTLVDQLPKIAQSKLIEFNSIDSQNLKELAEKLYFYADELMENVTTLLNLHISLSSQRTNQASHRTNEVVRILTIFSVFLLPLNLLTGIYGMNFEFIPELKWKFGYPVVLILMLLVTLTIYAWFRKKGWLKSYE